MNMMESSGGNNVTLDTIANAGKSVLAKSDAMLERTGVIGLTESFRRRFFGLLERDLESPSKTLSWGLFTSYGLAVLICPEMAGLDEAGVVKTAYTALYGFEQFREYTLQIHFHLENNMPILPRMYSG